MNMTNRKKMFVFIIAAFLILGFNCVSRVNAATERTTIYLSDDTNDYVKGSRSKIFTVNGNNNQTVTFSVAYYFEDRDHSQSGLLKFTNLTQTGKDATIDLYNKTTSGKTYVNLLAGCQYRVTLSARCGGYYMATYNVYR